MRFSVVINTYNRAVALRNTLLSLRHQVYQNFEVLVVNGPSTDGTDQVLAEFDGKVRALRCSEPRLAVSRNVGIAAAAGEVVAFIDDDSLATPYWLAELAEAFEESNVGAVGGLVYDPTGTQLQYRYAACHRNGCPVYRVQPPLDPYTVPGADPVAYLQGTNMAYSRAVLREIGGFDEQIRHFYDDVDVCLRVIDRGYKLKQLDGAAVHHKFLASHVRDHKRMTLDPFNQLSDRAYFGLKHGRTRFPADELVDTFRAEAANQRLEADLHLENGAMTQAQRDFVHRRTEEAIQDGLSKGNATPWAGRVIPAPRPDEFVAYPTLQPSGTRLRVGFISREYPPGDFGGPGRYTHELAGGFAAAGHEVHVITRSPDIYRLDLEDGAWIHRLPTPERLVPELDGVASAKHIFGMVAAYHEVCKIHAERPFDIVLSPLWLCEGLVATLDERFATAVTVITAMKAVATLTEWARTSPESQQLVRLEEEYIHSARHLHAISGAIRDRAVADYDADVNRAFVAPLGVRDRRGEFNRKRPEDGKLRILYVGRLETRKGADVFLEMAARLGKEFPHTEFVMAGKELPMEQGGTHRERFNTQFADDPEFRARVTFTGIVTDDELYQHYADCDIFCLPTHYESFGLVFTEAMMWGKPLVGSRVGGVPEVVADGEQGFLCPVGDADAITESVRKLVVDPDLRAKFGRRSRELFEQKWEMSVAVTRMAREFEGVVRQHRSTAALAPTDSAPREKVQAGFAAILERVVGIPPDAARSAANRLLNPMHHPIDLPRQLQLHWEQPTPQFVENVVYRVLLGRGPRNGEEKQWHTAAAKGLCKVDIIRCLTEVEEFRNLRGNLTVEDLVHPGLTASPHFPDQVAPTAPVAVVVAVVPPPRQSMREWLAGLPVIGKLLRYVKSVVVLPWSVHKMSKAYPDLLRTVDDVRHRQLYDHGHALSLLMSTQHDLRGQLQTLINGLTTIDQAQQAQGDRLNVFATRLDTAMGAHAAQLDAAMDAHAGRLDTVLDGYGGRLNETDKLVRELYTGHLELQMITRGQIGRVVEALEDIINIVDSSADGDPAVVPMMAAERKDAG